MRRLAAIAAIFGASAGLDAEQLAELHAIWIEILSMHRLGPEQQIVERSFIDEAGVRLRPGLLLLRGDRGGGRVVRRCWHLVLSGREASDGVVPVQAAAFAKS
jgi:hypothetical protein